MSSRSYVLYGSQCLGGVRADCFALTGIGIAFVRHIANVQAFIGDSCEPI